MAGIAATAHRAAAGLLVTAMALGLGACGGGGSSSQGPTEPPFLRFAETSDGSATLLRVWDPADPAQPLVEVPTDGAMVHAVRRRNVDAAARAWQDGEVAQLVFTHDFKVYRIDLRGGQPHAPVQLSSLVTACAIDRVEPLDAEGTQAVVSVTAAPSTDRCFIDNQPRLLHTGMNAGSAAVPASLVAVLAGDDAQASAVLSASGNFGRGGSLALRTPDLAATGGLQGEADHAGLLWLGPDPTRAGLGYFHDGSALRSLSWTANGAVVSAPLLALAAPPQSWQADGRALWLATAPGQVARAAGGSATLLADLALTEGSLTALAPTPTRLLTTRCVFDARFMTTQCSVLALSLSSGGWTTVYADQPGVDAVSLLGAVGERPLLRHHTGYFYDFHGFGAFTDTALRLLGADGSPGELLSQTTDIPVWAARHGIGQPPALAGALDCSVRLCVSGQLLYRPLNGPAQVLGDWPSTNGSSFLWPLRPLIEGLPGELRRFPTQGLQPTERYTVTPGTAGSLALVK